MHTSFEALPICWPSCTICLRWVHLACKNHSSFVHTDDFANVLWTASIDDATEFQVSSLKMVLDLAIDETRKHVTGIAQLSSCG